MGSSSSTDSAATISTSTSIIAFPTRSRSLALYRQRLFPSPTPHSSKELDIHIRNLENIRKFNDADCCELCNTRRISGFRHTCRSCLASICSGKQCYFEIPYNIINVAAKEQTWMVPICQKCLVGMNVGGWSGLVLTANLSNSTLRIAVSAKQKIIERGERLERSNDNTQQLIESSNKFKIASSDLKDRFETWYEYFSRILGYIDKFLELDEKAPENPNKYITGVEISLIQNLTSSYVTYSRPMVPFLMLFMRN